MDSLSIQWRKRGNAVYKSASANLNPTIKRQRLNEAISHYDRALNHAAKPTEKSSACKNIAMSYWRLAAVAKTKQEEQKKIIFYYMEALKHYRDAHAFSDDQNLEWKENVMTSAITCWMEFRQCLDELDMQERVRILEKAVLLITDKAAKAEAYIDISTDIFHTGVTSLHNKEYKKSMNQLRDCYFPLNEARRFSVGNLYNLDEVDLLEEDVFIQTCVTESIQARVTGDEVLAKVVLDEEVLNMDIVWEVTDWYKTAIILTRENDFEMEAIAYSRLGQVYDKILMMKNKAKQNFNRCLHLANLMVPRTFHDQDWFIYASSALQRYQEEIVNEEESKKDKKKEVIKEEIKEDLEKINKQFKESTKLEFLKFVYKNYPPRNPSYKNKEIPDATEMAVLKKLFCKAVVHYHPDKVDVEKHGLKWKVMSEEITKLLTCHYESYKMCD